jgi:hypothetical protein
MSGYGNRERSLRANASDWAGRVIEDATRDVQTNAAPLELIAEVAFHHRRPHRCRSGDDRSPGFASSGEARWWPSSKRAATSSASIAI